MDPNTIRILYVGPIWIRYDINFEKRICLLVLQNTLTYFIMEKISIKKLEENNGTGINFMLNCELLSSILHLLPLNFFYFLPVWIRIRFRNTDPDPLSCWIRIQFGSGTTTLIKTGVTVPVLGRQFSDGVRHFEARLLQQRLKEYNVFNNLTPLKPENVNFNLHNQCYRAGLFFTGSFFLSGSSFSLNIYKTDFITHQHTQ